MQGIFYCPLNATPAPSLRGGQRPTRQSIAPTYEHKRYGLPRRFAPRKDDPGPDASEIPTLRAGHQKVAEHLDTRDIFQFFRIDQIAIKLGHIGFRQNTHKR